MNTARELQEMLWTAWRKRINLYREYKTAQSTTEPAPELEAAYWKADSTYSRLYAQIREQGSYPSILDLMERN